MEEVDRDSQPDKYSPLFYENIPPVRRAGALYQMVMIITKEH
ncbi:MAG TPA: hypothetical protein VI278_09180 [Nitrososphaeraceae archaeon]